MQLDLPGLWAEPRRCGTIRYRVRVKGQKYRKITLSVAPDHPDFLEHYRAARAGTKIDANADMADAAIPRSMSWLTYSFEKAMAEKVKAGLMDASTLQQRAAFYARLRKKYGDRKMEMPRHDVVKIRDSMIATPGAADNMVKAIRALYAWAIDRGDLTENPAAGIGKINRGTGATPWSVADLSRFREKHPVGSMAHLALTLFMFTACRISDIYRLGPRSLVTIDGVSHLDWQPAKRGSARVTVPILPPLARAIAAQKVAHPDAYLLTQHGRPFASAAAFGNKFRDWCVDAGLTGRTPHGIRKAAGELMAIEGATQYHIMAVHGHTQAKTSEIYTKGVNRQRLAAEAVQMMAGMEW